MALLFYVPGIVEKVLSLNDQATPARQQFCQPSSHVRWSPMASLFLTYNREQGAVSYLVATMECPN